MDVKELRIGNIVSYESRTGEIFPEEVNIGSLYRIEEGQGSVLPLALTEEWLFKLGFKEVDSDDDHGFILGDFFISSGFFYNQMKIKHVHQLQNLYFALTGEELTIA